MAKNKWFAYNSTNDEAKLNLLCFPYAGGSASIFLNWKKLVSSEIAVFPVQYPFREARRSEKMPESVQLLAQNFVDENIDMLSSKEFAIFAHCAGATIAYEVIIYAKQKYNIEPKFFIASGAEPPEYSLDQFAYLENASDNEFLLYLIDNHFVKEDVLSNTGFLTYYIPIIREDFKLLFKYAKSDTVKLPCPLYVFVGSNDLVINKGRLDSWNNYCDVKLSFQEYEGDHYYFLSDHEAICTQISNIYMSL